MVRTITFTSSWLAVRRLFFVAFFLLFATIISFCLFYLFSSYQFLVRWYLTLNGCIFNVAHWSSDFFTPVIKSDGMMYCIIAMLISIAGIYYILTRIKTRDLSSRYPLTISYDTADIPPLLLLLISAIVAWTWGNKTVLPAYDEVFSAQNIAGINPFQCISYYMEPNNHIFFNFINNILFHPSIDKVITGRLISLFSYCGFSAMAYHWLKQLIKNRWLSFLSCLALTLQFFIWGFSFQARGYELYLLLEWTGFVSLTSYIATSRRRWLHIMLLANALGYFCLPSMLYFHLGQMLCFLLYQAVYRRRELLFWKYQAATISLTFLLYLPVLCFSGLERITHNSYVAPLANKTIASFISWSWPLVHTYLDHIFTGISLGGFRLSALLFFLPLLLLGSGKNKPYLLFALFYVSMWVSFICVAIFMKRLPFERNLIGHYSFTLTGVIAVAYWLTSLAQQKAGNVALKWITFPAILILFIVHFATTNAQYLKDTLYEYNVNDAYNFKKDWLKLVPAGSTVACSDEEFYALYICRTKCCIVSKCPVGKETYYLKHVSEPLPPEYNGYELINDTWGYQIYRKPQSMPN